MIKHQHGIVDSGPVVNGVTIFPIVFDSQPEYVRAGDTFTSLLQLPIGGGRLLDHYCAHLPEPLRTNLTVVPSFPHDDAYEELMRQHPAVEAVVAGSALGEGSVPYEPSDWLFFCDPRFTAEHPDFGSVMRKATERPRKTLHQVVLDAGSDGVRERIELDQNGLVRRIRRYYDEHTWSLTAGVTCSLVPASCLRLIPDSKVTSLVALRQALFASGVPSDDLLASGRVFDLSLERDLLTLNERVSLHHARDSQGDHNAASIFLGNRCMIHPSARLFGPVMVQDDVVIADGAVVVGPTTIGARVRVDPGARVVRSVIASDTTVPDGATLCDQVWISTDRDTASEPLATRRLPTDDLLGEGGGPSPYIRFKTLAESIVACAGLIALIPLLAIIAILIKLDSRGSVVYCDQRESKHGKTFRCWKFRTMVEGADGAHRALRHLNQMDGPQFKIDADPRITRVGRWLRKSSLDELPQLLNVMLGQMSLVGPRPSPFSENQTCIPWRDGRLSVLPGITGLWQVCRHSRKDGDFHQWIYYDLAYVRHVSFWVDVKILLATLVTLGGRGHVPVSWIISRRRLDTP